MIDSKNSENDRAVLYGADYSVYTRIARLVLEEVGMLYDFAEVDIFERNSLPPDYRRRHPFLKIPAFEHGGFTLYETDAIARYVTALQGGGGLLPADPRQDARAVQIMRIVDNYAYPRLVWGIYVPEKEGESNESVTQEAIREARLVLGVLEEFAVAPFLLGKGFSLADIWAAPVLTYFQLAPTGAEMMTDAPALQDWLSRMRERPSMRATRYPAEAASV